MGRVDGIMDLHRWANYYIGLRKKTGTWIGDSSEVWLDSPFFVDENGECFSYDVALKHWRKMMTRAKVPTPEIYAFHGLRVNAYNAGQGTDTPDLIVETGDWLSAKGHARYGRRRRNKVLNFAADMVTVASGSRAAVIANSQAMVTVAGGSISTGGLAPLPVQALLNAQKQSVSVSLLPQEGANVPATSKGLPDGCFRTERIRPSGEVYYCYTAPGAPSKFYSLVSLLAYTSKNSSAQDADSVVSSNAPGSSKEHMAIVPRVSQVPLSLSPVVVVPRRLTAVSQRASTPSIAKKSKKRSSKKTLAAKARLEKLLGSSNGWDVAR